MRVITIAALVSLTAACAANPSPVHVAGATSEIDRLAGEWTGEYTSVETGRSGSITFTLRAGSDTAFGDVVMIPRALAPLPTAPRAPSGMTPTSLVPDIARHQGIGYGALVRWIVENAALDP